ncbi:unnamed protein product [Rhizophagus irregularis]|nr:unnamed protein product [Rhizophagus irregularis]
MSDPPPRSIVLTVEITSPSIIYAPLTTKTVTSQANAPIVTETAGLPLSNIELNTSVTNNIVIYHLLLLKSILQLQLKLL